MCYLRECMSSSRAFKRIPSLLLRESVRLRFNFSPRSIF